MAQAVALKPKDYKSDVDPIWCPGCGDFGDLAGFTQALASLQLDMKDICIVSGIGCSGRFSHFIKCYSYHTAHGRALPTAQGVKAHNPDLNVFVVGGDGDGFSIGGGHIPHTASRNPNITYLLLDNGIYGLTKGQGSPTSPMGMETTTTPFGMLNEPINPVQMLLAYGTTFVARGFSSDVKDVAKLLKAAIEHNGFSVIQLISPCPTFNKVITFDFMKSNVMPLPEDHDVTDLGAAYKYALDTEHIYTGIFHQRTAPTMEEKTEHNRKMSMDVQPRTLEGILAQF